MPCFALHRNLLVDMGVPSGVGVSSPWPPLPTNLAKKQVVRFPSLDEAEVVQDVRNYVEQERRPLKNSEERGEEKVLLSEIELAIYWDRHAYEYRKPKQTIQQAANLRKSQVEQEKATRGSKEVTATEKRDTWVQCSGAGEMLGKSDMGCQTSFRRECRCYCNDCKPKARAKTAAPKLVRSVQTNTNMNGKGGKAGPTKTEYKGKFRNPAHVAEVESRILKQKVLNRCCNESIF